MTAAFKSVIRTGLLCCVVAFLMFTSGFFVTSANAAQEEELTPTPGWELIGTCEWHVDDTGHITIRPANGRDEGDLPSYERPVDYKPLYNEIHFGLDYWPWNKLYGDEFSFSFEGHVKAHGFIPCFFAPITCYGIHEEYGTYITSIDLTGLDTSDVTDMTEMFSLIGGSIQSLDLSGLDTSKVTNFSYMFAGCEWITTLDLTSFDTSKATSFKGMFSYCTSLEEVDLSSFDTSQATDMSIMFHACESLNTIDVHHFDTSKVVNMGCMFFGCKSLESLDLSAFRTPVTTDMNGWTAANPAWIAWGGMFKDCTSLKRLDISHFDTTKLEPCLVDIDETFENPLDPLLDTNDFMFDNCPLEEIIIGEKFTFQSRLPDKTWYNSKGESFTPATIPVGVADTYRTNKDFNNDSGLTISADNQSNGFKASYAPKDATKHAELKVSRKSEGQIHDALLEKVNRDSDVAPRAFYEVTLFLDGSETHNDFGNLKLSFPVDAKYNNAKAKIYHCHNNDPSNITLERETSVENGFVTLDNVTDLSMFAIGVSDEPAGTTTDPSAGSNGGDISGSASTNGGSSSLSGHPAVSSGNAITSQASQNGTSVSGDPKALAQTSDDKTMLLLPFGISAVLAFASLLCFISYRRRCRS